MRSKSRKRTGIFILVFILIIQFSFLSIGYSQPDDGTKIDAILLLDASGSMVHSDPNGIGVDAVKMFIDMCSASGDQIGVVAYSDQIVYESPLTLIKSDKDKERIKTGVSHINKRMDTDIGLGLRRAVELMELGRDNSHKPMIILLSDGKTDLKNSSRTPEQSEKDKQYALQLAKDKGYPVYTIGLNADGSVDQNELRQIASGTQAKSFVTASAENLPQILSEIFADYLKLKILNNGTITGTGDYVSAEINIPDSNVTEANISLLSKNPVEVKLFDNKGQEQPIPSGGILYSKSNNYSMLKIMNPAQGKWILKVKGISGDQIKINLIFNYSLKLTMEASPKDNLHKGSTINVKSYLSNGGQKLNDKELYKEMKAVLTVKDMDSGKEEKIALTNSGDSFSGSFTLGSGSRYELRVRADSKSFYRESESMIISAGKAAPAAAAKTSKISPAKIILPIVLLLVLAAAVIAVMSMMKKSNRMLVGQVSIDIRDENTGKLIGSTQYRKLNTYKGKATLHQLLQLLPEFAETERIIFMPGKNDRLIVKNMSSCIIEKSGRTIDASKGFELRSNDRINITLAKVPKSIYLEYYM